MGILRVVVPLVIDVGSGHIDGAADAKKGNRKSVGIFIFVLGEKERRGLVLLGHTDTVGVFSDKDYVNYVTFLSYIPHFIFHITNRKEKELGIDNKENDTLSSGFIDFVERRRING